ncbi:sigma-70 family RNA polymerase sigma factor [Streptomyces sp. NPDC092296]|uniref:sigma-70 family RNA polymerase sigma factor n=1 Tax=Streptomyces sp. NPDC092296 TaxID=3366012 RepID=UPI0038041BF4
MTLFEQGTGPLLPVRRAVDDERLTALALAARSGRHADVEAFIAATHGDVWRFVAHLAGVESADDLTQETYLRALGSLHRFAARASARTWLLSIARRVVVDRHRHDAARPRRTGRPDWRDALEGRQPTGVPGFEEGVALVDLLAAVPAERRAAFVLTQITGLSYPEAAEVAHCPVGTVRSRVARARAQLVGLLRAAEAAAAGRGPSTAAGGSLAVGSPTAVLPECR